MLEATEPLGADTGGHCAGRRLPGASRHHWGHDVDIYDAAAMPEGYQIQLTPEEVEGAGIFAPMHDWLDRYFDKISSVSIVPMAQIRVV